MHTVVLANYNQAGLDIIGTAANIGFGNVLSMSNHENAIVVSLPNAIGRTGAVRVFQKDSNMSGMAIYIQVGLDIAGKASGDYFGNSVSMSGDGTSFVVGARYSNNGKGSVSVYKFNTTNGNYTQVGLDIVGKGLSDSFGY